MTTLPDGLVPSPMRLYTVPGGNSGGGCRPDPCRMRGFQAIQQEFRVASWGEKSSADILDFSDDFTQWFGTTGDAISGDPTVTITLGTGASLPGSAYDLTVVWVGASDDVAVVMLASGVPGTQYRITLTIQTDQGRTKTVTVSLKVNADTPAVAPPAAGSTITVGGVPITVNGQTITP